MCQNTCKKAGVLLGIEPASMEPLEYTHFDCWSPSGDETTEQYKLGDIEALGVASKTLASWADSLSLPEIHPSRIGAPDTFVSTYLDNHDQVFKKAVRLIIKAGYAVYTSDTRIEIYLLSHVQAEIDANPSMVIPVTHKCCGKCQNAKVEAING